MKKSWLIVLLAISLFSCKKENLASKLPAVKNLPVVNNLPITVYIDQERPGYTIPETFEGLSFETGLLVDSPGFLNEHNQVLIRLIKNLGAGVLRIGGNSSDIIKWTNGPRNANTPENSLTTTEIRHLTAFDKTIGWPVIFGLNLGEYDPSLAASEAVYVSKSLQNNLYALQSGNEPDVFSLGPRPHSYNYFSYHDDWRAYFNTVRKEFPDAPFAGPDVTPFNSTWINKFTANESKNINLVDGHYYDTGPASMPSIHYSDILSENTKLADYLGTLHLTSSKYHLPFRVSECNSVFGGGKSGVSNVFASALWALDFMWEVAEYKGQGVNFHGGGRRFFYSPVGADDGAFIAKPEYYAMLAFKYGAVGQTIVPVSISHAEYNVSAHACVSADSTWSVTLINKELKSSFAFTIKLNKTASTVQVARLQAPDITSATGTTFAGSLVNADGSFYPNITEQYSITQKSFVVNVPAGSAAVVTIR
jgi:hypothetical protein